MGNIIICETKTTNIPYTFENTKVEVFSYEELCFYLYNNSAIISLEQMDIKFVTWIAHELAMVDLAENITKLRAKEAILMDILVEIFTAKNYYTIDEVKIFIKQYERLRNLDQYEREKIKGDCFLAYKRYIKAADIYEELLTKEAEIGNKELVGNIYHNHGIALAHNLEINEARLSFLTAFTYNGNMESLKASFLVLASQGDESRVKKEMQKYNLPYEFYQDLLEEFEDTREDIRNMSIYAKVEKAIYNKNQGNMVGYDQRMNIILNELKDEFREQAI